MRKRPGITKQQRGWRIRRERHFSPYEVYIPGDVGGNAMMKAKGSLRIALGLVTFATLSILYLYPASRHRDWSTQYLVDGPNCKIPNMDPFDSSIQQYLAPTTPVICSNNPPLTQIILTSDKRHILQIDKSVIWKYKKANDRLDCCFSVITRISQHRDNFNDNADDKYKVSQCEKFEDQVNLNNTIEFLLIHCLAYGDRYKKGKLVYGNAHAVVPLKKPIYESPPDGTKRLNVLIIGIDSVSRLSIRRTMPLSLNYLFNSEWTELNGYNKIGDNTLPNVMALLSGKNIQTIKTQCLKGSMPTMDDCPNIWTDFRKKGYLTAYAEDVPLLATFNYKMTGFVDQPTDFYMRPFMLAAHNHLQTKNKDGLPICIGPQSAADLIFDYAKNLAATYQNTSQNYFGFFWLNSFSHNNVNDPAALDVRLHRLLNDLEELGVYNNTLLILLSDHGVRFGKIRKSFQSFLEERLPFIFLKFPPNFLPKNTTEYISLNTNRNRLTSPFDVYATLKDVLGEKNTIPVDCPDCQSLLTPITQDRSCQDAGIDLHWCTCPNFEQLSTNDAMVTKVGDFLMQRITNRTEELIKADKLKSSLCVERSLTAIVRAHRNRQHIEADDNLSQVYLIVIVTEPFGLFEASIRVDFVGESQKFQVLGFISRLDSYDSTTKCVKSKMLSFYCYCSTS